MFPSEKKFADLLTKQKKDWQYHPARFNLGYSHYTPDFYLPKEKLYIEVVGTRQAFHSNKSKILLFKKLYPHIKFIIVDYNYKPISTIEEFKNIKIKNSSNYTLIEKLPIKKNSLNSMKIHIEICPKLHQGLLSLKKKDGQSLNWLVNKAIENYLKAKKIKE